MDVTVTVYTLRDVTVTVYTLRDVTVTVYTLRDVTVTVYTLRNVNEFIISSETFKTLKLYQQIKHCSKSVV